jgi:hypothetical protein
MKKSEAIKQLGDTTTEAAKAIGITAQALSQWPDELPPRLIDRVQAALWRRQQSQSKPKKATA